MVTTAGAAVRSTCRLTIVCSAVMICALTTIGSTPSHGAAPWVCLPRTVIFTVSELAISPPPRVQSVPCSSGMTCRPKIASTFGLSSAPCGDHLGRAPGLTGRRAFLGRLEDELDGARQLGANAGQHFGHSHQHRHVGIVSAGVHHAHVLAVVGRSRRRPERAGRPAR